MRVRLLRWFFSSLIKLLSRSRVEGLEKLPANARFLKVEAAVIEYVDMSLKLEGYAANQVWTRG